MKAIRKKLEECFNEIIKEHGVVMEDIKVTHINICDIDENNYLVKDIEIKAKII